MRRLSIILIFLTALISLYAVEYNPRDCEGSLSPYPVPERSYDYPDTLQPIFINHIGRHGARYPAGSASSYLVRSYLKQADSLGTITKLGKEFLIDVEKVIQASDGKWGALDSLGVAEQEGIASRMYANFPMLLNSGNINAIATYSPRVVQSMYSFTHQLTELSTNINITTGEGKRFSPLLRFFDTDTAYVKYLAKGEWKTVYQDFLKENCNTAPIRRLIGANFKINEDDLRDLAMNEYYLIAGMRAMQMPFDYSKYFTLKEYNQLWSIFNFRQYLQRTASVVSNEPIYAAKPLLSEIIATADSVLTGKLPIKAKLRFCHAETMMPLLSLMALPGCYYMTNYYDTVGAHWKDFYVTPMATNLQLIFFTSPSGTIYVRGDLNEVPVPLIRDNPNLYVPWDTLRIYLLNFLL